MSRSREARVPAVLEMLGIPYTGSDPFTMAVTLDKDCAKKLVAAVGVAVPAGFALEPTASLTSIPLSLLKFPLVVKPAWEGSSKGIRSKCLVSNPGDIPEVVALASASPSADDLARGVYRRRRTDRRRLSAMASQASSASCGWCRMSETERFHL